MEAQQIIKALEALAQESRLAAFRALVKAGPPGLTPSVLSEKLDLPAPTLSFHLAQLRHAGLVNVTRDGRSLIYVANYDAMSGVIGFLTENCCADAGCAPASCKPSSKEKTNETPARARRRA
ncbi:MAG: helix-turn-helix domain-containing protein [Alphaproteobacteria bacterium]|jgi:DNA-binding transcriptional ArsR family regulator|nr:helix-turn-helix domain-containing protein [Alphaproteobacteria bacterium]